VDAIDYQVPVWIKAAAAAMCLAGGVAAAGVLEAGLGDPTWSVSSGIGALFAAAIFEVGRPKRLSVAEAQTLESQWQDFGKCVSLTKVDQNVTRSAFMLLHDGLAWWFYCLLAVSLHTFPYTVLRRNLPHRVPACLCCAAAGFADARLQRSGRCHESEVFTAFRQRFGKYRSADVIPDSTLRDMVRNWHPGVERTRTGYLRNISLRPAGSMSSSSSSSARSAVAVGSVDGSEQQQQQQQAGASAAAGVSGDAEAAAEPSLLDAIAAEEEQRKQQQTAGGSTKR
jgi:hypothetical protein